MLGAITGDIIGSTFDKAPHKSVEFPLFPEGSRFTDDSVMTVATAFSLLTDGDYAANYRLFGRLYPLAGYGEMFGKWLQEGGSGPYDSWGNGSAMRVSPIGWAFDTEQAVLEAAAESAVVTHSHPEGIKGAQAVALAVFLARSGADKPTIRARVTADFGYDLARTAAEIRPCYGFDVSCQGSVPESLICFLEGEDWLHAVRLAVSLGGDADTMACITGAVAEAFHGGVPQPLAERALAMLPAHLVEIVDDFRTTHMGGRTDARDGSA